MILCSTDNMQIDWPGTQTWHLASTSDCVMTPYHLNFSSGEIYWLQGNNGVGKSTWMRVFSGLLPRLGSISWSSDLGSQMQRSHYLLSLTRDAGVTVDLAVQQEYFLRCGHVISHSHLAEWLHAFNLTHVRFMDCVDLSSGQKRRLQLMSLLYSKAPLWLLDEPYTHLDDDGRSLLEGLISSHVARGGVVVMTGHESCSLRCHAIVLSRR